LIFLSGEPEEDVGRISPLLSPAQPAGHNVFYIFSVKKLGKKRVQNGPILGQNWVDSTLTSMLFLEHLVMISTPAIPAWSLLGPQCLLVVKYREKKMNLGGSYPSYHI